MQYTPTQTCCPSCKEVAPLSELACTCPQCENDFNPFLTFGGCLNCQWTVGRLRCKVCGNKFELAEWLEATRGERSMFQFFRELLEMREMLQVRSSETPDTGKQDHRLARMSSVIMLTARVWHKGKCTEKKVRVSDMINILARLLTENATSEERMSLDKREWHLDRGVFQRALNRLTKDLRLAERLKPVLKDSTIRINSFTVDKLASQVKALRRFNDYIKSKRADLFFTVKRGQTLQPASVKRSLAIQNTEATRAAGGAAETILTLTDLTTWNETINLGSEKLLDFFSQMISEGRKEGQLTVRNNQPDLVPGFSVTFAAEDFIACSAFLLAVFEESEYYEKCAHIMALHQTVKHQLQITGR